MFELVVLAVFYAAVAVNFARTARTDNVHAVIFVASALLALIKLFDLLA